MGVDRRQLFEQLDPPPGGVERLRRRLVETPRGATGSRLRYAIAGVAAALGLVVAVIVQVQRDPSQPAMRSAVHDAPQLDRLLGREPDPFELTVRVNEDRAGVVELASSDPKVRVYEID